MHQAFVITITNKHSHTVYYIGEGSIHDALLLERRLCKAKFFHTIQDATSYVKPFEKEYPTTYGGLLRRIAPPYHTPTEKYVLQKAHTNE